MSTKDDVESQKNEDGERTEHASNARLQLLILLVGLISLIMLIVLCVLTGLILGKPEQPEQSALRWLPHEPALPGIMPGVDRPHLMLAQDIDYPPYAYLGDPSSGMECEGFGHDIAMGLEQVCEIEITVVQTKWSKCWSAGEIGTGLLDGHYHGCMTYTHTAGMRNRFVEFSEPILDLNKAGGLIARLDPKTGKPLVDGKTDLKGLRVVDVVGWAPTEDGLQFVKNPCTGKNFKDFTFVKPTHSTGNANDDALLTLMDGSADVMWVYADQAYNYHCTDAIKKPKWNCSLWGGIGKDFAYIQTGMYDYAVGGTTLSMSKKGSGLKKILDPCIAKFKKTKSYYDLCKKNGLVDSCYTNAHFPAAEVKAAGKGHEYNLATNKLKTSCADGYCPCS